MSRAFIQKRLPFKPTDIGGCSLWLDGTDPAGTSVQPASGSTISTWVDKSGNGRNATQVGGSLTYASTKGVTFDGGSSSYYSVPSGTFPTGNTFYSFFLIVRTSLPAGKYSHLFSSGSPAGGQAIDIALYPNGLVETGWWTTNIQSATGIVSANTTIMLGSTYNSTGLFLYGNGTTIASSTTLGSRNSAASLGYVGAAPGAVNSDQNFIGTMFEAILFSAALTTPQRQQVESYLAQKWGLRQQLPQGHPGTRGIVYPSDPVNLLVRVPYTTVFTPTTIANCTLWLDGSDQSSASMSLTGSNITQWNDKSGNNNNFTLGSTYVKPNTLNGLSSVYFNGSTYMSNASLSVNSSNHTGFIIALADNIATGTGLGNSANLAGIISFTNGSISSESTGAFSYRYYVNYSGIGNAFDIPNNGFRLYTPDITPYAGTIICEQFQNGTGGLFLNGVVPSYQNTQPTMPGGFPNTSGCLLGLQWMGNPQRYYQGNINEFIMFNSALTTFQRQTIEGYLAWKWGLQANLPANHPYKNAPPPNITNQFGISRPANVLPIPPITISARAKTTLQTRTFTYTGTFQSFTVPATISPAIVTVYMWGAGGGGGYVSNSYTPGAGGAGAMIQGTFSVTSGQTLYIIVGGGGSFGNVNNQTDAQGGGGKAYYDINASFWGAGSGGGRSAIQLSEGGSDFIVVGGGGGGAVTQSAITNGGSATFSGTANGGTASTGGTQISGGTPGANGETGSKKFGGAGWLPGNFGGGGGGGGYWGGGGGGIANGYGSGGGGSSYTDNLSAVVGYNSANGVAAPNTISQYYQSGIAVGGSPSSTGGTPGTINLGGNGLVVLIYTA